MNKKNLDIKILKFCFLADSVIIIIIIIACEFFECLGVSISVLKQNDHPQLEEERFYFNLHFQVIGYIIVHH